jgi:hypothetical protein
MIRLYQGTEVFIDLIVKLYAEHGITIDNDDAVFDALINAEPISIYEASVFARSGKVKVYDVSVPVRCVYEWIIDKLYPSHNKYTAMSYILMSRASQLQQKKTISIFTVFHSILKEEVDMDILEFIQDPSGAGRKYASLFIGVNINKFKYS